MSVYRSPKSPNYSYDFQYNGIRYFGSTGCTQEREAKGFEKDKKAEARRVAETRRAGSKRPMTLTEAVELYWAEEGYELADHENVRRHLTTAVAQIGPKKTLVEIDDTHLANLVLWRKVQKDSRYKDQETAPLIAPATVNRSTVKALQPVWRRARKKWKMKLINEPDWAEHLLDEPEERIRELQPAENAALSVEMDEEVEYARLFSLISGLRQKETLLEWSQINFATMTITRMGKGGKRISKPITPMMFRLLKSREGHDKKWVFTYIAKRTTTNHARKLFVGVRYPITKSYLQTEWRRGRDAAGVVDYRWHDNRHTFASHLLRTTKNLKLVQIALGHSNIRTTSKYAHVLDNEVRAGMIEAEEESPLQFCDMESRNESRTDVVRLAKPA